MATMSTPERRVVASEARTPSSLSVSRSTNPVASPSSLRQSSSAATPLTVESALSNANDDVSLALEQVVSERNTLSSQNMQLWRLIEKQRSAHSNVLKELERVRGERDRLLNKVDPDRPVKKAQSSRSPSVQVADDGSQVSDSRDSSSPIHDRVINGHRAVLLRQQSEDDTKPSPSTVSVPSLSGSRSHEPLRPPNISSASASASTPGDLVVNPPINGSSSVLETVKEARDQHLPSISTSPPTPNLPPPAPVPTTAPPPIPLSQPTRSGSSESSSPTVGPSGTQPLYISKSRSLPTPGDSVDPAVEIVTLEAPHRQTSLPESSLVATPQTLDIPGPSHRESRISLPAEASRYIASMQESPIPSPSPRQAAFVASVSGEPKLMQEAPQEPKPPAGFMTPIASSFPLQGPPPPAADDDVNKSAFLEMDDDDDDDDEEEEEDSPTAPLSQESLQASLTASVTSADVSNIDQQQPSQPQLLHTDSEVTPHPWVSSNNASYAIQSQPQPLMYSSATSRDMVIGDPNYGSAQNPPSVAGYDRMGQGAARAQPSDVPIPAQVQTQRMPYGQASASVPLTLQPGYMVDSRAQQGLASSQSIPQGLQLPQPPIIPQTSFNNSVTNRGRLVPDDFQYCRVLITGSHIRPNDRGKEVLSFVILVCPRGTPERMDVWKVEKLYSDILALDSRVKNLLSRSDVKKLGSLPDSKLFKDNAPAKVDQRKAILEIYLQTVLRSPVKDPRAICEFFNTDVINEANAPVTQSGYKEGYLTKRGKNFGGWKTRYFVLQGPVLEYYENRGGTHLGSINITGAQIGRQQKSSNSKEGDDENEYRHAFLIIENKKGTNAQSTRHVLCAESDQERDAWVDVLVRYVMGTYDDTPVVVPPQGLSQPIPQPRPSTSSIMSDTNVTPSKRAKEIAKGPVMPMSQLPQDSNTAKFFHQTAPMSDSTSASSSPLERYPPSLNNDRTLQSISEVPMSSSLPSNLDNSGSILAQRSASELGHYPDMLASYGGLHSQPDPRAGSSARRTRVSVHPNLATVPASSSLGAPNMSADRAPSPSETVQPFDPQRSLKISGPMNGTPIPAGYNFGARDVPSDPGSNSDRDRKAKSRNFWGFGRKDGSTSDRPSLGNANSGVLAASSGLRAVFGVPIVDSLAVAQIANLPAVVYRCIEYLEAKKAEQEEGIYRLSGSSAVIKNLKDRFNTEGDVNLLASDEFWDPHAIAGLLKSFLRELPTSVLTRDLHLKFLAVIDLADPKERVNELAQLVAQLPVPNYSLLRALTAHLILIVQNCATNKMNMRNVGIVFSPTLGIPAGVFSLMLGEFNQVFNVDGGTNGDNANGEDEQASKQIKQESVRDNRNSRSYADAAADQMLGLAGRSLKKGDDSDSADEATMPDSTSGHDTDADATTTFSKSTGDAENEGKLSPNTQRGQKAFNVAASRGLRVTVDRRKSGLPGLPHSPRPMVKNTPPSTPH